MHVILEYTAEVETPFSEDFLQRVASRTLEECRFSFLQGKEISLNVVAVTPERIQELNARYRGKDSVTDILAFGEYVDRDALKAAEEGGGALEREMIYIFSHGVLHLVGFDHEDEMFAIQERVTDMLV